MYDILAENYGEVFPVEHEKIGFIQSYLINKPCRLLDIGCATGDTIFSLAGPGLTMLGIDLNKKMIHIAKRKNSATRGEIEFKVQDMLQLNEGITYDCVLCLGNTLPHLGNWPEVDRLIRKVYATLADGGAFIFQILNYDKILKEKTTRFDKIETKDIVFEREYGEISEERIAFNISLTDKKTNNVARDSTMLLPITHARITRILSEAGFKDQVRYSDYRKNEFREDGFYAMYVSRK